MVSVLYELLSGTLSNTLKSKLDKLLSHNQSGSIPNRYIGYTTRLIYDIMHYTEQKQLNGLLMCIDFKKAFKSLSWKFGIKLLIYLKLRIIYRRLYRSALLIEVLTSGLFNLEF